MESDNRIYGKLLFEYLEHDRKWYHRRKLAGFFFVFAGGYNLCGIPFTLQNYLITKDVDIIGWIAAFGSIWLPVGLYYLFVNRVPFRIYDGGILLTNEIYTPFVSVYELKRITEHSFLLRLKGGKRILFSGKRLNIPSEEWIEAQDIILAHINKSRRTN